MKRRTTPPCTYWGRVPAVIGGGLAEMLCQPRRDAMPTSPRCYANRDLDAAHLHLLGARLTLADVRRDEGGGDEREGDQDHDGGEHRDERGDLLLLGVSLRQAVRGGGNGTYVRRKAPAVILSQPRREAQVRCDLGVISAYVCRSSRPSGWRHAARRAERVARVPMKKVPAVLSKTRRDHN